MKKSYLFLIFIFGIFMLMAACVNKGDDDDDDNMSGMVNTSTMTSGSTNSGTVSGVSSLVNTAAEKFGKIFVSAFTAKTNADPIAINAGDAGAISLTAEPVPLT